MVLSDELERDLKWREDELAVLKAASISTEPTHPHGRAMRRAYLAMLYAHYEGFAQFAWTSYLLELRKEKCRIEELCLELQAVFSEKQIKLARQAISKEFLTRSRELLEHLQNSSKPDFTVPETANLWPNVFEEMSQWIGLSCDYVDEYRPDLKSLVSRRNDVAHGKRVEVDDEALQRLENAVWAVTIGLALEIVDRIKARKYLAGA
ncbi:MAG: MAE_28990/MAE_18760 family HEPN-like nuclease [Croceibacterium sp.]